MPKSPSRPRAKTGPTPKREREKPQDVGSGKFNIPAERILEKVQQDPEGARIAQMAFQQCIIEDQHKAIQALQDQLILATNGDTKEEGDGE